jgi:hypothetical protein
LLNQNESYSLSTVSFLALSRPKQIKAQQATYPARQQRGHAARQRPPNNLEAPDLPSKGRAPTAVLPQLRPEAASSEPDGGVIVTHLLPLYSIA